MIYGLQLTARTSEPITGNFNVRGVEIQLNGHTLWEEFVYDTDENGNRTEAQALWNALTLFSNKLREQLETEGA